MMLMTRRSMRDMEGWLMAILMVSTWRSPNFLYFSHDTLKERHCAHQIA